MNIFIKKGTKGFSLIELMVVISIIIILIGITMASIMEARKKSRDERRVSDVANIALTMTLYKEKNRDYPSYPSGIELGKGGALDDDLLLLNGNTYLDPLSGDSSDYSYWYYSNFLCNGERVNVVLAKTVERSGTSNYDEVCGGVAVLPMQISFVKSAYAQSCTPATRRYGYSAYDDSPAYLVAAAGGVSGVVHSSQASANQICMTAGYTTGTILYTAGWNSPGNNYITQWTGTAWQPSPATSLGNRFIAHLECVRTCPAPTQCNDGDDNADTEDTLIDMADPGCTSGTDTSEDNTVTPAQQSDAAFAGSYIILLR
jgi:prepilin-type N-terminal cleavage/methylation domain-containing protein